MTQAAIKAPMAGTVVQLAVGAGEAVHSGQLLLVLEAMKMEHEIRAEVDGRVLHLSVTR
jgi:geranyl-CoA carboxylase alpha subunit